MTRLFYLRPSTLAAICLLTAGSLDAQSTREARLESVKSVVAEGGQQSLDPLIAATRDNDPEIQIRAVDGLVNFYLPGYVKSSAAGRLGSALKSRFEQENRDVVAPHITAREDVVRAIAQVARGGSSMESRANAARALGILRAKAAVPDLLEALKTKDDAVLFESLIALQKIQDQSAAPGIVFLLRDLQEKVQVAAIETTGLLKNREAIPDLQKVYADARSDKVRRAALTALAMLPDESSRGLYWKAWSDKNDGVRAAAAEGFARLKSQQDVPALEKAFNEERKMAPRLAVAFGLVANGNRKTGEFQPLTYLINSLNSKGYRGVAEPYLVEAARDEKTRRAIESYVPGGTKDEKAGLARVLAASGDKASMTVLETLAKDPDAEVAREAARALQTLRFGAQ